jgi:hypothetical protein
MNSQRRCDEREDGGGQRERDGGQGMEGQILLIESSELVY